MMQNVRKRLFSGLLVLMLAICMCCVTVDASESDTNKYEEERGVALVYSEYYGGNYSMGTAFGIGTVGENTDTFVTNKHVVCNQSDNWAPAKSVYLALDEGIIGEDLYYYVDEYGTIQYLDYDGTDTSEMVKCDVIYVSEDWDFAILKTASPVDRIALELASGAESEPVRTPVYAIGYPGVSEEYATANDEPTGNTYDGYPVYHASYSYGGSIEDVTTTDGIISKFTKRAMYNDVKVIQHTAFINHGNSGGPLITSDGKVLGIDTYGISDDNMFYAIYIDYVLEYLDQAGIPYNITNTHEADNEASTNEASTNEASSSGIPLVPIIIVIAIIVVAVIVVVMVMGRRKPTGGANATKYSRPVNKTNAPGNQSKTTSAKGNSELRFCPYCGAQINGDAKFCGNCGKPLP